EKYLGPIALTNDIVEDYLRNMSYIIPKDVSIIFVGEKNPNEKKKKLYTRVYNGQGLSEAVKYMSSSLEFPPIEVKYSCNEYDLSISFSYDRTLDDTAIASFCNFVI